MARQFFEDLIASSPYGKRRRRSLTLPVSIAIHVAVFSVIVLAPILLSGRELPEVAKTAIPAFIVEAAAPPPPPPPPPPAAPAAPKPKTVEAPKIETPKPEVVPETPKFVAPVETPKEPEPTTVADSGADTGVTDGVPGGEAGGVEGGVQGGVKGGVEGGTVGGVEGGTVGGVQGGVIGGLPKDDPPPSDKPVRVGGSIQAPKKVRNVDPRYPEPAKAAHVSGIVVLECVISPQGRVESAKVLKGIPLLDESALEAVKQWVYSPTLLNGVPVPVIMTVTVTFKLG